MLISTIPRMSPWLTCRVILVRTCCLSALDIQRILKLPTDGGWLVPHIQAGRKRSRRQGLGCHVATMAALTMLSKPSQGRLVFHFGPNNHCNNILPRLSILFIVLPYPDCFTNRLRD